MLEVIDDSKSVYKCSSYLNFVPRHWVDCPVRPVDRLVEMRARDPGPRLDLMIAMMMIDDRIMIEMDREWNCAMVGDYRQPAIEIMRGVHFLVNIFFS